MSKITQTLTHFYQIPYKKIFVPILTPELKFWINFGDFLTKKGKNSWNVNPEGYLKIILQIFCKKKVDIFTLSSKFLTQWNNLDQNKFLHVHFEWWPIVYFLCSKPIKSVFYFINVSEMICKIDFLWNIFLKLDWYNRPPWLLQLQHLKRTLSTAFILHGKSAKSARIL